jgi:DNA polymerase-1
MPRLFVLDALGLAYRAYYAFIRRPLVNSKGENASAVFGFANMALKLRREEKPDHWALAWDGPGPTFRHERYPEYKATRKPMPEDLLAQLPAIEDVASALGLPLLEIPGVEADDVMASLARRGERDGYEVTLVTSDKDLVQLVNDRVKLLSPTGRGEDYAWVDRDAVHAKWGVAPEQVRDVLALMGDSSDNIPGVPGVGEKTAVELIRQFGSLAALYDGLEKVARASVRDKLAANRDKAMLSYELVTVREDLDLPWSWDDLRRAPIRRDALLAIARRYELTRLERVAMDEGVDDVAAGTAAPGRSAERRGTAAETPAEGVTLLGVPVPAAPAVPLASPPPNAAPAREPAMRAARAPGASGASGAGGAQGALDLWGDGVSGAGGEPAVLELAADAPADLDAMIERLHAVRARSVHGYAVMPVVEEGDPRTAALIGLALSARDGTACYLPIGHVPGPNLELERVRAWLAPAFADVGVPKVAHDLKRAAHILAAAGLPLGGLAFDVHIASFLCDPARDHGLEALARDTLAVALPPLEPPARKGRGRGALAELGIAEAAAAAIAHVGALYPIAEALRAQLEAREQVSLYTTLEHPLIPVLLDMERAGIRLDSEALAEMGARMGVEIARLEGELATHAGGPVNWNSGPQLAKLLFETLGLKAGRRTKTGYSTDQAVLEELAESHPFPKLLLEYRVLTKLKSTYVDALPQVVDAADGRVHTTFDQTGAATGRLSSSNPNLQNIPMRTPQGRAIRHAFVAAPGSALVGADYSQIELRVMAHLSGDPQLIAAFEGGEDVHASTARRIFGLPADQSVDPALRARAKVVNFGVIYGMGARSLSQQMGIGLTEAQEFIAGYFRVYARVRDFLDATLDEARRRGYVQTLLGRRRYLPELASAHGGVRSNAERAAINTPIQGSAADIMKLAMIRVHAGLKRLGPSSRLLLQVHDELLLECPTPDVERVETLVRREMEGCIPLRVPLVVSVGRGASWFDVH